MPVDSRTIGCTFHFPGDGPHRASVAFHKHHYGDRLFWYGTATFLKLPGPIPLGLNGGRAVFDDDTSGIVSFIDGGSERQGMLEVGFVGLSPLEVIRPDLTLLVGPQKHTVAPVASMEDANRTRRRARRHAAISIAQLATGDMPERTFAAGPLQKLNMSPDRP